MKKQMKRRKISQVPYVESDNEFWYGEADVNMDFPLL